MKKLEKLKLQKLEEINVDVQKSIVGGGHIEYGPDGLQYYVPGETTISATGKYTGYEVHLEESGSNNAQVTWDEFVTILSGSFTAARAAAPYGPYVSFYAYVTTYFALWAASLGSN